MMGSYSGIMRLGGIAVVCGITALGCGTQNEAPADPAAPVSEAPAAETGVDFDRESRTLNVRTEEGAVSIGEGVEMPDGYPEGVPMYPGLEIYAASADDTATNAFTVQGKSEADVDAILDWYLERFKAGGWQEDMVMAQPGMTIVGYIRDGLMVNVVSTDSGAGTDVSITTGDIQD